VQRKNFDVTKRMERKKRKKGYWGDEEEDHQQQMKQRARGRRRRRDEHNIRETARMWGYKGRQARETAR